MAKYYSMFLWTFRETIGKKHCHWTPSFNDSLLALYIINISDNAVNKIFYMIDTYTQKAYIISWLVFMKNQGQKLLIYLYLDIFC